MLATNLIKGFWQLQNPRSWNLAEYIGQKLGLLFPLCFRSTRQFVATFITNLLSLHHV